MFTFLKRSGKSSPVARKASSFRPALEGLEDRLALSPLHVTSAADNGASGTLRWAVNAANADAGRGVTDTIDFARNLTGATITLTRGPLEVTAARGSGGVNIDGGSNLVSISGNHTTEIFQVDNGACLWLKNLTLKNGNAYQGGAILNRGRVGLNYCTMTGNTASYGGAIANQGTAFVDVYSCSLYGNSASQQGGAILNSGAMMAFYTSFNQNSALTGGAVANFGNVETAYDCYFTNNVASQSGGGFFNGGTASFSGTAFYTNRARNGGGLYVDGVSDVENCTFGSNSASVHGAAIYEVGSYGWGFTLTHPKFSNNTAPDHDNIWVAD